MPTIPPPPNPPPVSLLSTTSRQYLRTTFLANAKPFDVQECLWAKDDPEVHRACFFAKVCTKDSPKSCVYLHVKPILQVGPTCGLVALSMVMQGRPTAGDLLKQAKKLGYTNNGEMFSTKNLLELFKSNISLSSIAAKRPEETVRAYLYDGLLDSEFIKEKLQSKCMILVPYDADRNHQPCNLNGSKAHWALIVGYLIDNNDDFYVFARHGKTKNLGLFSLSALSESNENLNMFSQPHWHPEDVFLLPEGGINGPLGLKSKSIIIDGLQNEAMKIV